VLNSVILTIEGTHKHTN